MPTHAPGLPFSWESTRGILVFAGTQATSSQILQLDSRLRSAGWPRPLYHVCSETEQWLPPIPWPAGPSALSDENLDALMTFLSATAGTGSQVLLDVFCTVRDDPVWMDEHAVEYARTVGRIASEFAHVAIHIANEPWHGGSWFDNRVDRLKLIRDVLRDAGFMGPVGADDNASRPGDVVYNRDYRDLGFWADFHPWREDAEGNDLVPRRKDFREMVDRNPFSPVHVISEPIAFSVDREGGCCTDSRDLVIRNMCDAEAEGLVWTYHSTDGLSWPSLVAHFSWIPPGRC